MSKKWIAAVASAALLLGLCGCDSAPKAKVYVQNVGEIVGMGSIAVNDTFPGIVVSEQVVEIERDTSRTVKKLYVSEGQAVNQGDLLFEYDSEEIQLTLDKQNLELEQLNQTATTLKSQIAALEAEKKNASKDDELSYTVEIQTKQAEQKENEYNIKVKKREIEQTKASLANAQVLSTVTGRVATVNESGGYDPMTGKELPYITIQQSGSYRVKGTINELSAGSIVEGAAMRITARTDDSRTWTGTVSLVDWENPTQGNSSDIYFGMSSDEMTSSSRYPFYVELDSADGLLLGQHVYLTLDTGSGEETTGLWLPEYYLCYDEPGEDEAQGAAYVWAANDKDKLEKRYVTLGGYDEALWAWEILDGLTVDDDIALPDSFCVEGAHVTRNYDEALASQDGLQDSTPMVEDTGGEWYPGEEGEDGMSPVDSGSVAGDMMPVPDDPDPLGIGNLPDPDAELDTASDGSLTVTGGTATSGNLGG